MLVSVICVCCSLLSVCLFLMIRRPPRSTRTDTLFPYTTLFRSVDAKVIAPNLDKPNFIETTRVRNNPYMFANVGLEPATRSEEHTSELQSLMRISYAVFCLKKKKKIEHHKHNNSRSTNYTMHTIYLTHTL